MWPNLHTAQVLAQQKLRLEERRSDLAKAVRRVEADRASLADSEPLAEMSEEERVEFVRIRKGELDAMERRLAEKQTELDRHIESNGALLSAMAATAAGDALSASDAQRMIERQALELDALRSESEARVARLQAELADARAALSADAESLQDQVRVRLGGLAGPRRATSSACAEPLEGGEC